ncbi:metallophosphoesterase [Pseudomonadota bacterium]
MLLPLLTFVVFTYPVARLSVWFFREYEFHLYELIVLGLIPTILLILGFRRRIDHIKLITVNWLGVCFIFSGITLIYEITRLLAEFDDQAGSVIVFSLGGAACIVGVLFAQHLNIRNLVFYSTKLTNSLRIVQITDVHIGSRHARFLIRVVDRINLLHPDMVVITGDLVDTSRVGVTELTALTRIEAPIYMIIGNHERYAGLDHVLVIVADLGITVLRNEAITMGDVQIIGIDDSEDTNQVALQLPKIWTDKNKFRVLLYHRPQGWAVAVQHNIELMLSGHTHNGQIYPFNWLVKRQFKHLRGLFRDGNTHLYVSPGTGTWGPLMRLGSRNEITCIDLKSATPSSQV